MNHSLAMSFFQRFANLDCYARKFEWDKRTALQAVGKGFTFDVLHDQIVGAVLAANVIERANVWMVQAGDGTGFAFKTLAQFRCVGQMWWKNFQRHRAIEARILRAVNFTHATSANRRNDFVGA